MTDERVKEIYDGINKQRVVIYRRESGSYFYEEEHFSEHPTEMCWVPYSQLPIGIYDSQEKAEIEARANIDWLKVEGGGRAE